MPFYWVQDSETGEWRRLPAGIVRWFNGTHYAQRSFAYRHGFTGQPGREVTVGIHNGFPAAWFGPRIYRGYRAEDYDLGSDTRAARRMTVR